VVWQIRGPRVLAALLVGAALSVAGTAFQGLFRNPLVSPDILGASAGAALGAVLGIYFSLGIIGIQAAAFVGGLVAVALVYLLGSSMRAGDPVLMLLLTGVVVGSLLGAGIGLVKYLADPTTSCPP
jgi:iron complex transport system permease protein